LAAGVAGADRAADGVDRHTDPLGDLGRREHQFALGHPALRRRAHDCLACEIALPTTNIAQNEPNGDE
jgi:hypothetical protein